MTLQRNALILAGSSVASYALGLVRDRLLAGQFGAGEALDVYNAAFVIPDFIMNFFAAGLAAAVVPVFTAALKRRGKEEAFQLVSAMFMVMAVLMIVMIGLAWILAPWLTLLTAPGFSAAQQQDLVSATRILLFSPLLLSLSVIAGSSLQGMKRFVAYAISPPLYNLSIVIGIVLLAPLFGINGVLYGVVIGAGMHLFIRVFELALAGWHGNMIQQQFQMAIKNQLFKITKLFLPRMIALATWQANLWLFTALASQLAVGSISIFNFARNFQSLPVSLFGIALATAVFPVLASHHAEAKGSELNRQLSESIRYILFLTLPASAGMIVVAHPLIETVLGGGEFTADAIQWTASVLMLFSLSIPLESLQHVLARAFYAKHNTTTPVLITLCSTGMNVTVSMLTYLWLGVHGLALGFLAYVITQVGLLVWQLQKHEVDLHAREIWQTIGKGIAASVALGFVAWGVITIVPSVVLGLGASILAGTIVYAGASLLLRMPEATAMINRIRGVMRST